MLNLGNWTKKVARSAMAVGAAVLVVSGPVHAVAQEAPTPVVAQEPTQAPAPAPEGDPAPAPVPDGSHLLPEGVKESTPAESPEQATQPQLPPEGVDPAAPAEPVAPVDSTVNPAQPIPNGQTHSIEMEHEGKIRRYLVRVPNNYNPEVTAPVLFGFGGWEDSPENFASYNRMGSTGAANEAIIVYPEGFERAWEAAPYAKTRDGEDIRFIQRILDAVDADYRVDRSRVYAMGMSNGGGFTSVLGCHAQETFAAIATVSGAFYNPVEVNCVDAPMHTLIMHGVNDRMMQYEGGTRHEAGYLPVRDVVGGYLNRNRCDMTFQAEQNGPMAERLRFNNCLKAVELLKVKGDHTWWYEPDTSNEVWNFLSDKRK
ncbi:alpha/beta hydrolase-fold protein [Corynebacterium striatum]|uniref:alpha/beta hydrolase family esterase n=1 Tax=Corynebacterium striatum TaxID=43770 RepID=UPI003AE95552